MDKSSLNSLNSKRNFKLPPIQGALPAQTFYGERTWNRNKPLTFPQQPHVTIKKESIPTSHSLHRATFQTRSEHYKKTVVPSPRQRTTVQLNLGHEFPKSYSVLPPISKPTKLHNNGNSSVLSANKINPVKREIVDKKYSSASELLSERRRERLLEKHKGQKDSSQDIPKSQSNEKGNECLVSRKPSKPDEKKESMIRKHSATLLLYLKSKRNNRRGGVCPENEGSLINVTEQLKEIFLRRNMEEMYLI